MKIEEAESLLRRYQNGDCTPDEKRMLESWYLEAADSASAPFDEALYLRLKEQSWRELKALPQPKTGLVIRHWKKMAAAAVLLLLGFAWFYGAEQRGAETKPLAVRLSQTDRAPAANKATLRLSNGNTLVLSSQQQGISAGPAGLQYLNGTALPETEALSSGPLTLIVPRGGTYRIRLSDGSQVWLNADSRLTFSNTPKGKRTVELTGEAYFEVFKDPARPFLVQTSGQQIEVLGTHFNVNAYPDAQSTRTTLLEGAVRLSTPQRPDQFVHLRPQEEALLGAGGSFSRRRVNAAQAIAWQQGRFSYHKTPMLAVMRELARWYNIEVQFENEGLKSVLLSGSLNRYENLSGILAALTFTSGLDFQSSGNLVTVRKIK